MKKALVFIAAALVLAGCSSSSDTSSDSKADFAIEQDTPMMSTDEMYLYDVREAAFILNGQSDSKLISLGREFCSLLDEGVAVEDFIYSWLADDPSDQATEIAVAISGNAIEYYCPEYAYQLGAV